MNMKIEAPHRVVAGFAWLAMVFYFIRKPSHRLALPLILLRKRSRSARLFACKRAHNGSLSLPTFCGKSRCQRSLQLLKGWQRHPLFDPSVTRGFAARATSPKTGEACTAPSPRTRGEGIPSFFDPSVTHGFAARATSPKTGEACTAPTPPKTGEACTAPGSPYEGELSAERSEDD
jgi:hypothetical protein